MRPSITVTPYGASKLFGGIRSLVGATLSSQETSCPGYEDHDVWFSFVATFSNLTLNINNVVGYPSALEIFIVDRHVPQSNQCPL
ncbi:MAG: hypothetical protein IPG00_06130 [Saprospiraceae bacterium]|nr:hypothetical protein [Saprospiraceae bacterium]